MNKPFSLDKSSFKMFLGVLYSLAAFNGSARTSRNDDGSIPKRTLNFHSDGEMTDLDGFCTALSAHDKEPATKTRTFFNAGSGLAAHIDSKVSG